MGGSLAEALGPACFRFLRPILVVGCGGGSYLGLSFCSDQGVRFNRKAYARIVEINQAHLLVFFILASLGRRASTKTGGLITLERRLASMPARRPGTYHLEFRFRKGIGETRDNKELNEVKGEDGGAGVV